VADPPPSSIWRPIESLAPGVYTDFILSVLAAVDPQAPPDLTSWWRNPVRNFDVGGDRLSQHLLGLAADLRTSDLEDRAQLAARLRRNALTVSDEGDHLHVQLFRAGAIPEWIFRSLGLA